MTKNQLFRKKIYVKNKKQKTPALMHCPQRKAICLKFFALAPKKPNSAKRKCVKVSIYSLGRSVLVYIPGEAHKLQPYGVVLIRGGRTQDLPGLRYKVVLGKLDASGVVSRKNSRSKYGTRNFEARKRFYFKKRKSER